MYVERNGIGVVASKQSECTSKFNVKSRRTPDNAFASFKFEEVEINTRSKLEKEKIIFLIGITIQ